MKVKLNFRINLNSKCETDLECLSKNSKILILPNYRVNWEIKYLKQVLYCSGENN